MANAFVVEPFFTNGKLCPFNRRRFVSIAIYPRIFPKSPEYEDTPPSSVGVLPMLVQTTPRLLSAFAAGNKDHPDFVKYLQYLDSLGSAFWVGEPRFDEKRLLLVHSLADLPVVCGLGKSRLISSIYPEQFELRWALVDGFKVRQNPQSTNYR